VAAQLENGKLEIIMVCEGSPMKLKFLSAQRSSGSTAGKWKIRNYNGM